jgi:hypothetical protein
MYKTADLHVVTSFFVPIEQGSQPFCSAYPLGILTSPHVPLKMMDQKLINDMIFILYDDMYFIVNSVSVDLIIILLSIQR